MSTDPTSLDMFREEVRELLAELDNALMILETEPLSQDAVNRTFRAVHTLKGDCALMGLTDMESLLHDLESVYDKVRQGELAIHRPLMDLTFAIKDALGVKAASADPAHSPPEEQQLFMELTSRLDRLMDCAPADGMDDAAPDSSTGALPDSAPDIPTEQPPAPDASPCEQAAPRQTTFAVHFAPASPGQLAVMDPSAFLDELCALGQARITPDVQAVPLLEALDPATCALSWHVELTTDKGEDAVRDVFLFLDNPEDVRIDIVDQPAPALSTPPPWCPAPEATPQAPSAAGRAATPTASGVSAGPNTSGEGSPRPVGAPPRRAPQAPEPQAKAPQAKEPAQSLRVEAAKLDNLVNLVGELVIAQARLNQIASRTSLGELTSVAEEMERLVGELRDNTLNIRMLPIGTSFSRFRRLVRDLSGELRKEIELVAEGGETELDKTVIEQLGDPLVHLLRNSIDHGVEAPDERQAAGKPRRGRIVLSAKQAGGAVIIRITDDGKGLDPARIRTKAVERGIISAEARLSEQETFQLIFAPGFSTAEKVTNVSGRGVGMDVVKRAIEALRGKVDIASQEGKGTVITITLPLTLAIIDGLQVQSGREFYIIPLAMVEECVEFSSAARKGMENNRTISLRGEIVPFVRLRETFAIPGKAPGLEQIVITRHENGRTGIAVDQVVGQQQTVIKNLGRYIGKVEGISGATINGDGSMSLILDVSQLVESVQRSSDQAWLA